MAKTKIREITITESKGALSILRKSRRENKDYVFNDLSDLRRVLSNERARLLHIIKTQNPDSIYDLAKKLSRNFKSVKDDVDLLERFGLINIIKEKTKNRIRHKPVISVEKLTIHFKI